MSLFDWRAEIVKGVIVHQRLAELDTAGLWSYHLPELAASEDEIEATESALGHRLDPQFREFLRYANGWRSFYQDVDIFGTRALLGEGAMGSVREMLAAVDPELFFEDVGLAIDDILPVAASDKQTDIFLMSTQESQERGVVIWFAGYTIDRFDSFNEFYLSMLDYNRRQIFKFEGRE
ncbi:SMI1/KNR4 family protein [Labedaea rhizosphaerae]|uniref:SUKH superfamily protein n=1 Tax=Labedaea rhizosphaerae TaxID=598644 RepID=A0A4R6SCL8_LABRH|nr:SMI1/KNR4 family protein [Labedaea rhizosphaerae]TDP96796.1 SUKH superfamily protein [Labedaea rhizosphaerae]